MTTLQSDEMINEISEYLEDPEIIKQFKPRIKNYLESCRINETDKIKVLTIIKNSILSDGD